MHISIIIHLFEPLVKGVKAVITGREYHLRLHLRDYMNVVQYGFRAPLSRPCMTVVRSLNKVFKL